MFTGTLQRLAAAGICYWLSACGGGPTPTPAPADGSGLLQNQSLVSGGVTRSYSVFVPSLVAGQKAPIVILLHGNGGSAAQLLGLTGDAAPFGRWLQIAQAQRIVLIVPDGVLGPMGSAGWNDCRSDASSNPSTDDVAFVDALLDVAIARYGGDPSRIYASGISNGGQLAIRLGIERAGRFAAIAPVAAALAANSKCAMPSAPIGLMLINGTADPIRPDAGGAIAGTGRGTVLSTTATFDAFRRAGRITAPLAETALADGFAADNCTATRVGTVPATAPDVVLMRINGGGHTEPSPSQRYSTMFQLFVGRQNGDFEMADTVWAFFESQRR